MVGGTSTTFDGSQTLAPNAGFEKVSDGCAVNQAQSADVDQNHLSESATLQPSDLFPNGQRLHVPMAASFKIGFGRVFGQSSHCFHEGIATLRSWPIPCHQGAAVPLFNDAPYRSQIELVMSAK